MLAYTGAAVAFLNGTVVVLAKTVADTDELFLDIADVVMFVRKTDTVVFLGTATVEELVMAKVGLVEVTVIVVLAWPVALVLCASLLELVALTLRTLEVVEGACHGFDHGFDHGLYHGCVVKALVFKELVELLAGPTLKEATLDEVNFGGVVPEIVELALTDVGLVTTTVELDSVKPPIELVLGEVERLMDEDVFDVLLVVDGDFVVSGVLTDEDLLDKLEVEDIELGAPVLELELVVLELELAMEELELDSENLVEDVAASTSEMLEVLKLVAFPLLGIVLKILDELEAFVDELETAAEELTVEELELWEEDNAAVDALVELWEPTVFDGIAMVLMEDSLELEDDFAMLEDDPGVFEDDLTVLEDETEKLDETDEVEDKTEELEDKVEELEDKVEVATNDVEDEALPLVDLEVLLETEEEDAVEATVLLVIVLLLLILEEVELIWLLTKGVV